MLHTSSDAPPTYTLSVETDYAPVTTKQGLTKPELRERLESILRNERVKGWRVERERVNV